MMRYFQRKTKARLQSRFHISYMCVGGNSIPHEKSVFRLKTWNWKWRGLFSTLDAIVIKPFHSVSLVVTSRNFSPEYYTNSIHCVKSKENAGISSERLINHSARKTKEKPWITSCLSTDSPRKAVCSWFGIERNKIVTWKYSSFV